MNKLALDLTPEAENLLPNHPEMYELSDRDNYPPSHNVGHALLGWDDWDDLEQFSKVTGYPVHVFQTRDGHHFWQDKGAQFAPFNYQDYLNKQSDDYLVEDEKTIKERIADNVATFNGKRLIDYLNHELALLKEIEDSLPGQVVISNSGLYEETLDETFLSFRYDVFKREIGILLPE